MATMTYREQLLHPNWQRKRLDIMQRDEFQCQRCYDAENTLHVHHKQYVKGRLAWEYPDAELVTLCESCHEQMHETNAMFRAIVATLPVDGPGSIGDAISMLAGLAHGHQQGMEFVQYRDEGSPFAYLAGVVAQRLECTLRIGPLSELTDALRDCPSWVIESAVVRFTQELVERLHDPAPAEYFKRNVL